MRDVIVVGGGLAGLTCAWHLSETLPDAHVLLLEQAELGGSSALAVGSFTVAGTSLQRRAGVEDSPAEHFQDLVEMCSIEGSDADVERYRGLLRAFCEAAPESWERLAAAGLAFGGPHLEQGHRKPRMHNALPDASAAVRLVVGLLCGRGGVELRRHAPVTGLDATGAGFSVSTPDGTESCPVLVIAGGDRSAAFGRVPGINPNARGTALDLAAERLDARSHQPVYNAGLRTVVPGLPHVAAERNLVEAATAVLDSGERIPGPQLLAELEAYGGRYLTLEVADFEPLLDQAVSTYPGIGFATLRQWIELGQAGRQRGIVVAGPLRVAITLADGALDVDSSMSVLAARGPVPNLYACGSAALGGIQLNGHGHHLMWAAVSARWAAESIAGEGRGG